METPALLLGVPRAVTVLALEARPLFLGYQPVGAACWRFLALFGSVTAVFVEYLGNKVFDVDLIGFAVTTKGLGRRDDKGFECVIEPVEESGRFNFVAYGSTGSPQLLADRPAAIDIALSSLRFLAVISNTHGKEFLPEVKTS